MLKEELPFRCQPNTLGIAQKEAGMESVFQLLDGFADGGLADVKLLGCLGKTSGFGNFIKNVISRQWIVHGISFLIIYNL